MIIKRPCDIKPSEITDEKVWQERRTVLRAMGYAALGAAAAVSTRALAAADGRPPPIDGVGKSPLSTDEATRLPSVTALATGAGNGPLLPIQVVQP